MPALSAVGPLGLVVLDNVYGGEEDELDTGLAEVGYPDDVPETGVDMVRPEEMDERDRDVAVEVQVLGPEEFGTVSIPGPLGTGEDREGAAKLELVKKGVTVDGRDDELLGGEGDAEGVKVALVNGPFVDIDADGVVRSELSLPADPDIVGGEIVGVASLVIVCTVLPEDVPFDSELDGKRPVVELAVAKVSDAEIVRVTDCGETVSVTGPVLLTLIPGKE